MTNAKSTPGRVKRTPLTVRNRLSVKDKEPGYVYRIVNDVDDRIEQFIEQGYEIDQKNAGKVGDKRVDTASGLGSVPSFSVGQGTKAVVMRIKQEWYDEDQRVKQAYVKSTEETLSKDSKADYGAIEGLGR